MNAQQKRQEQLKLEQQRQGMGLYQLLIQRKMMQEYQKKLRKKQAGKRLQKKLHRKKILKKKRMHANAWGAILHSQSLFASTRAHQERLKEFLFSKL